VSDIVVIDAPRALELLREVVEGKEDYVYWNFDEVNDAKKCRYFVDGQPSCLVGHALVRAGVANNFPLAWNAQGIIGVERLLREKGGDFQLTREAAMVFMAAQECQDAAEDYDDRDHSWGESLRAAEDMYQIVVDNREAANE
jgi:hypothetical protein